MNWFERNLQSDLRARLIGLGIIIFGVAASWLLVYLPLKQVTTKRSESIHLLALLLPQLFVYCGLVQLLAGRHTAKFLITRHGAPWTRLRIATYAVGIVFCLGVFFGMREYLKSIGYSLHW
jgi:hypothetical protein